MTTHPWRDERSRFQTLMTLRAASYAGVAGAIVTVLVAGLPRVGLALGCASVAGLYVVYPLLSLLWGSLSERLTEWAFLLVGLASIVLALTLDPRTLAVAWALHGVWDVLHRRDHHVVGLRGIPPWYVRMCWIWDFLAASGLLLVL